MASILKPTEPLPVRMQGLSVDERGYVVPWFVAWVNGKPEFRAMDTEKFVRAIKERRCWVCGERLGVNVCFVAGPMCGINRTSAEPPSHLECARWSARNCPFLANPRMVRREDDLTAAMRENVAGFRISRNPGVTMLWITRSYDVFDDGRGGPLIQMGTPESVEWWCEGRPATREEVLRSIDEGLPTLEAIARQQEGALQALAAALRAVYLRRMRTALPSLPRARRPRRRRSRRREVLQNRRLLEPLRDDLLTPFEFGSLNGVIGRHDPDEESR